MIRLFSLGLLSCLCSGITVYQNGVAEKQVVQSKVKIEKSSGSGYKCYVPILSCMGVDRCISEYVFQRHFGYRLGCGYAPGSDTSCLDNQSTSWCIQTDFFPGANCPSGSSQPDGGSNFVWCL